MKEVLTAVDRWTADGDAVALAVVVETRRSAPQPQGAKMAVSDRGDIAGAVSGGCVEGAVVQVAETILAGADPQLLHYGIADAEAWDVGLPCGGEISIWVQRYAPDGLQARFADHARAGTRAALVTGLPGAPAPGALLLLSADGELQGTLGDPKLDAAAEALADQALWSELSGIHETAQGPVFVDSVAPPPRLILFGAVEFAAQLAVLASIAGWRVFVVDPRARFATPERFPAAERVIAAWPQQAIAELGGIDRATSIAVLTHDPKLDDAALTIALRSDAGYVGAMGSRRAQAKRRDRLLAAGLSTDQIARLSAPIGLDLGALTAEETAVSIFAEVIAARHGRSGGRLADSHGPVHATVSR